MSYNYKQIGAVIRVDAGYDISAATPTLKLTPEVGMTAEYTTGVTIPAVDVTVDGVTYTANQYIEYTTTADELDYVGRWKKKAVLTFSATNIDQTNYEPFRVLA